MPDESDDRSASAEVAGVEELLDLAVAALGGTRRDGQHQMAQAVGRAIENGEHLAVQAGTGTGKSLAYLVPAVRHAVLADERVVVSTATLALQRQVTARDLPVVVDAIAGRLPRPPTVALLKGWHNYLCAHKVAGGYPEDEGALFDLPEPPGAADHPALATAGGPARGESLGEQVVRLREWADETGTGDRDDLVPGVTDRAWRQVSVRAAECLGTSCPMHAQCFPARARELAHAADVVVTNHAMLGIAAATAAQGVLPEHDVLVVDEAHELADRVTAQATAELSVRVVEHAARLARRHGGVPTTDLDAAGRALEKVLGDLPEARFAEGLPAAAAKAVAAVRDAARTLLSALKPEAKEPVEAAGGRKMAYSAVQSLFETADRMTSDANEASGTVLWCARTEDRRGEVVTRLHAAPLVVAGLIGVHLLAGRTAVLTSATLTLGGSFDPLARSVGLGPAGSSGAADGAADEERGRPPAGDPGWRGLDVGSPFDYPRQGICYVARHLPPPGREPATEAQLDEIATLVEAAGGRTLGLFSSRRAATAAATALRPRVAVPILLQGDDQLPTLVRRFTDDEPTCLFGTLSLWQGVDVPGSTCRLVIVDRIPFPRPDDPLTAARTQAVASSGGNGFMAVSATHAALLLAQGAGRLIRSSADRGVVAVLDPRLSTARYGEFLQRSMPPFWLTTDLDVAVAALRRLASAG
ncbi:MAG TPA: ATP-dependent DNA helicase [Cellulomonas sp.]